MPIYEYRCQHCGKEFEVFRGVRDAVDPACKFCGGLVRRLISASSFHLKGSGWYATDYAHKKAPSEQEKTDENAGKSNSGAKTEKTESAAATKEGAAAS